MSFLILSAFVSAGNDATPERGISAIVLQVGHGSAEILRRELTWRVS